MITRNRNSRTWPARLATLGLALTFAWPALAQAQQSQQQVQELLRRTEELRREIALLRGEGAPATRRGAPAAVTLALNPDWASALEWRDIGPASMGGRIVAFSVVEDNPSTFWIATASGGLLKTTNNGITFEHQFDHENTVSIGDVCHAPSDPNIVWVGTGENNPRNSVSYGDGVYKSTDGGTTWQHMGLRDSFQTGKIAIHPTNPDIVYVGALGRLYGPNEERGVFKTTNGGRTWEKIHYIDDKTGVIDLQMHPTDPDTLIFATYERQRDGFDTNDPAKKWGAGSGLWKTTDGGRTVTKLTEGLPTGLLGRIGIAYYDSNPDHVYIILESDRIGQISAGMEPPAQPQGRGGRGGGRGGRGGGNRPFSASLGGQRENVQDQQGPEGSEFGGMYKSTDGGDSWTRINSINPRPMYFSHIAVDPSDENNIWLTGVSYYVSHDNGKTFRSARGVHSDQHALWIDPNNSDHVMIGTDGGTYITYNGLDRNIIWDHQNHVAIGQFYHVGVDARDNYWVYGGLQDNGSWGGPSRTFGGSGTVNEDWIRVGGGDGFVTLIDPNDHNQIYAESQGGSMSRRHLTGLPGGDGSNRPRGESGERFRFNWKTPFILSNHNSQIFYSAGNYVFKSVKKGDNAKKISPEITLTDRGSATALTESPLNPDILYVGTDDGAMWVTTDGGQSWQNIFEGGTTGGRVEPPAARPAPVQPPAARAARGGGAAGEGRGGAGRGGRGGGGAGRGGRGGGGRGGAQFFSRMDANGDGKLQKSEIPERMAGRINFEELDKDEDGTLSQEEFAAANIGRGRRGGRGGQRGQQQAQTQATDNLSGKWAMAIDASNFGGGDFGFTLTLNLDNEGKVTGRMDSERFNGELSSGSFNRETGELSVNIQTEERAMQLTGKVEGDSFTGRFVFEGGEFEISVTGKKQGDRRISLVSFVVEEDPEEEAVAQAQQQEEPRPLSELLPGPRTVSSLEASRFAEGRVYAVFDAHRQDDDNPYVFVSEDSGKTWRSLRANLPWGSTRVLREDIENENVLYLGTEFAAWVSVDRGNSWTKINNNLPTVAIHDFAIHPSTGEIVAATHGRSLWILDVSAIRQMTTDTLNSAAYLYKPHRAIQWDRDQRRGSTNSARRYAGTNPDQGTQVYYSLGQTAGQVSLKVTDLGGELISELQVPGNGTEAGLHRVNWRATRPRQGGGRGGRGGGGGGRGGRGGFGGGQTGDLFTQLDTNKDGKLQSTEIPEQMAQFLNFRQMDANRDGTVSQQEFTASRGRGGRGGGGGRGRGGRGGGGQPVAPGSYRVVLTVDGQEFTQTVEVKAAPRG